MHQEQLDSEETLAEFNSAFQLLPSNNKNSPPVSTSTLTLPSKNNFEHSPTPRKKKLLTTISTQKLTIKRKQNAIHFLNRRKYCSTVNLQTIISSLPNFVSGEPLHFLIMQLRHQRKVKWEKNEKNFSLSLYYKAPNVYRFLRDRGFRLPSISQIRKWINVTNVTPGFGEEVFGRLSTKAKSMSEDEKQCVLMFDEMSIKKSLEYNSKLDVVEGFQDLGPLGRENTLATHALVFMTRGLKHPWKCPVSYFLSHNSIQHTNLVLLIDLCISSLSDAGLNVKAIVNDLGSTNAAAMKLLGITPEKPYYLFKSQKIYCLMISPTS